MLSRLERRIVGRYLRPTRSEGFIFLVAAISLVAVALGVAALIAVMSVMNGFRAELFDRILGLNGHAIVQGYAGRIEAWQPLLATARATPGVVSATPLIEQPLMASHGNRVEGVLVRGMAMADIARTKVIADGVVTGDLARLAEPRTVAIGAELAQQLGVETGGQITLISPQGQATPFGTAPRIVAYEVAAVFRIGIFDFDKAFVLMRLDEAQTLLDLGDAVGVIEVKTADPDRAPAILMPLAAAAQGQGVVIPWQSMNAQLFEALAVERVAMFWILSIIILVAAFNIVSALIMLVRAKTRDIAILRTMGASRAAVLRVFVGVGLILGVAGTALGAALGFLILWQRQAIVVALQRLTGANLWDPSIRFLSELPARVDPREVVAITLMALVLSLLATLYPAWKAAATDPVAVLRHG